MRYVIDVLVGADTGGFEGFGAQLFVLVGDHMNAKREFVDIGTLSSEIKDSNLGVRYTAVEAGLWVWLRRINIAAYFLWRNSH